jgi:hypothetical protein
MVLALQEVRAASSVVNILYYSSTGWEREKESERERERERESERERERDEFLVISFRDGCCDVLM